MTPWLSVVLYAVLLVATGLAMLALYAVLGPKRVEPEKLAPYECGVEPVGSARQRFSVRFYLLAILFILFDIETVFLIPWAVLYRKLGVAGLVEMFVFLGVLGFGLVYIWRRGVFDFTRD